MVKNNEISKDDLPKEVKESGSDESEIRSWEKLLETWIFNKYDKDSTNISKTIDEIYTSTLIKSALRLTKGNKTEAAKILGWGRNTITNKMKSTKNN